MQLFAFNDNHELVSAHHAERQINYTCAECGGVVRLRRGPHRQTHFFHLKPDTACRQSQKSLVHLQVQHTLQTTLPKGEALLERRFPEIQRIGDVVWEPRKIIFEVQCSGISAEEVAARNRDYASLGYQVVWILHDRRFNRQRASAAELWLRGAPHYFTNIDAKGRGFFYDQADLLHKGWRRILRKYLKVSLESPLRFQTPQAEASLPGYLEKRVSCWPFCFAGDLLHGWQQREPLAVDVLVEVHRLERRQTPRRSVPFFLHWLVVRPYLLCFRVLLEKSCK